MDVEEFMNYLWENFNISAEARRLIHNILRYAERIEDAETQYDFLCATLNGTIGLSEREIRMISL